MFFCVAYLNSKQKLWQIYSLNTEKYYTQHVLNDQCNTEYTH